MFQTVKTLLNQNAQILPSSETTNDLCAKFASFFNDKVQKIRDSLDENDQCADTQSRSVDILENHVNHVNHVLRDFNQVSENDVHKLISDSATKSCTLDVMPTWLMKEYIATLIPTVTYINFTYYWYFPQSFW